MTLPIVLVALIVVGISVLVLKGQSDGAFQVSGLISEIHTLQRDLHKQLAAAMRLVHQEGYTAAWALVGLSFFYGVFHAAGPGHGKVVISTYLVTHESALRRGLALAVTSSLVQGITAVVAVAATVAVLGMTLRQAQGTTNNLELISFGLVALVGLFLLVSRVHRIAVRVGKERQGHDACADCGHSHGPSPDQLEETLSIRSMAALILSIGIRPCSGAILILLVAYSLDLRLAGVLAVMAMSLGTAITVSAIAVLSVYSRKGALRLATLLPDHHSRFTVLVDCVAILGALVILVAGVLLLQASLVAPVHPLR